LRDGRPPRERLTERLTLLRLRAELVEHPRHHLAVGESRLRVLDPRLDLVVAHEQLVRAALPEDPRELAPNPAVPVDQRAVAVERGPALGHGCPERTSVSRPCRRAYSLQSWRSTSPSRR